MKTVNVRATMKRARSAKRKVAAAGRTSRTRRAAAPEESEAASSPAPTEPIAPAPTPAISFGDVMGFSGLAPERVNGRLAMLGFVAAAGAELATNEPLLQ